MTGVKLFAWKLRGIVLGVVVASAAFVSLTGCARGEPPEWTGAELTNPRTQLTKHQLRSDQVYPLMDMSFFAEPKWATRAKTKLFGRLSVSETEMVFPLSRPHREGENVFPSFEVELISSDGALIPRDSKLIDTSQNGESSWDVFVGEGEIWQETEDETWSRASLPINLTDRFVGSVRNCVGTFVYSITEMSNVYIQCSQETADMMDNQLGDIRVSAPGTFERREFSDAPIIIEQQQSEARSRVPSVPLAQIDVHGEIARYFSRTQSTNAPISIGAIYADGVLYVHPPRTRHGDYPFPNEMRHGVYSVSKSLIGAVSMFYFAERYGEAIFDEMITDHVSSLRPLEEWQGVTFGNALDMATGTRGGEALELLFFPLMSAESKEVAISNIATFGDGRSAPGQRFNYATTNLFVLSYALQNYVEAREGAGIQYWELFRRDVLEPIGADTLDIILTKDDLPEDRIPVLGYGVRTTIDETAKIARLIANEGRHEGEQLLNRRRVRAALGRTEWRGYKTQNRPDRYRHGFWSRKFRVGSCDIEVPFMEGHGGNHVLFLPSGMIIIRYMDEFDLDLETLVLAAEKIRPSCA